MYNTIILYNNKGGKRERFICATWNLHTKIFQNYQKWCSHVNLSIRPGNSSENFSKLEPMSDKTCLILIAELSLFFCLWTEAHNMR